MAQIDITKMSSKGQVVIPQDLRKGFNEGDKLLVIRNDDQIIIKRADKMDKQLQSDIRAAQRAAEAWKEIEEGKGKKYTLEEFKVRLKNGFSTNLG